MTQTTPHILLIISILSGVDTKIPGKVENNLFVQDILVKSSISKAYFSSQIKFQNFPKSDKVLEIGHLRNSTQLDPQTS